MSEVVMRRKDPLNIVTLRQIKYVYDVLLNWIQDPSNPHRTKIRITPAHKITPDFRVVVGTDPSLRKSRPTHMCLRTMLASIQEGPVPLKKPVPGSSVSPDRMCVVPFEDQWGSLETEDEERVRDEMREQFEILFEDPKVVHAYSRLHEGHRFRCGIPGVRLAEDIKRMAKRRRLEGPEMTALRSCCGTREGGGGFAGDLPVVQNCTKCWLLGHNAGSCEERSSGTHVATALATLLDESKSMRHDTDTVHKTLWNVHQILLGMAYRVFKHGWEVEKDMCR
jgi:hypothetical protein